MALALALVGCGTSSEPPPAPRSEPAPASAPSGFRFEPTLEAHTPKGSTMELIAEAGDVAKGTLTLVVAHHDGAALSVSAWGFTSTGDDDTLVPAGDPAPLLALSSETKTDGEALDTFVRTRAAGHAASARVQGVDAPDAAAALSKLHVLAQTVTRDAGSTQARVEALAAFTRGLDDDLLFSRRGLAKALALLAEPATPSTTRASARRAQARWGEADVSLLRKGDGWTIDAL